MDNKPIFPDGLMWKDPSEKAPKWVKGAIHVKVDNFIKWLQENSGYVSEKGWLNLDLKESKKGGLYFAVNTYKPKNAVETTDEPPF